MKRLVLTDALILEALAPDPHVTAPAGLLAQVTADVARTPQHRTLRLPALPRSRRLAWVLVGAATLVALVGALFVAGGSRNPFEAFLPPVPAPLLQRLPVGIVQGVEIEAVSADEAWASDGTERLWHRTAAGWTGPILVSATDLADRTDATVEPSSDYIRDLARMPDGRLVVSSDRGIWLGNEHDWTRVAPAGGGGVAVDALGVIWAGSMEGDRSLRAYREIDGNWQEEAYFCGAGGFLVAASTDGSTWTAGIGYSGSGGLARFEEGTCSEIQPWGDGMTHEAMALATTSGGRVAIRILDLQEGDLYADGRIMTWDGARWTTVRDGPAVARAGWSGLSYGPDGSLWAAFDGGLWRYAGGAETSVRSGVGPGPVSVAPDGAVWFVAQDAKTGAAFVDRLLPDEVTPEPSATADATPEPSAVPELDAGEDPRLFGINSERAWIAKGDENARYEIWGRTSAGWTGPMTLEDAAILTSTQTVIRGMADLGDGRLAIATDTGLWVGSEGSWTRAWAGAAWDVAEAPDGRLWVSGEPDRGDSTLRALRETAEGWQQDWSGCRAGGNAVAIAADGSVWTSGISYSSGGGVARVEDGVCEELFPLGQGKGDEVIAVAASAAGAVAVHVIEPLGDGQVAGGRVLEWQDGRWTELRAGKDVIGNWHTLGYTPDGALWAVFGNALNRYASGRWQDVTTARQASPISVAYDGTVWYVRSDGAVDRLRPGDVDVVPVLQHDALNPTDFDGYSAVVAPIAEDEQWFVAPGSGQGLVAWHRTPSGWTGPYVVESDRANAGYPRALVPLSDGRFAVSAEGGLWVGQQGDWTRLRDGDTAGIAAGKDGTLWFGAPDTPGLMSMRETPDGWQQGPTSCAAGGGIVAVGPDGAVWSAPVSMQSPPSIVHLVDGRCEELVPIVGPRWQVLALGPDLEGGVTAVLDNRTDTVERTQVMHWDGRSWTTLRDVAGSTDNAALAYGADGTLWMVWNQALARYADGVWTDLTAAANGFLATTPDGTIWFFDEGVGYRNVDSLETPNP